MLQMLIQFGCLVSWRAMSNNGFFVDGYIDCCCLRNCDYNRHCSSVLLLQVETKKKRKKVTNCAFLNFGVMLMSRDETLL